jgi:putative hydrolase of the HAD superfamily
MGNAGEQDCFSPDHSILEDPSHHSVYIAAKERGNRFLISKEELGNDSSKGECLYDVCTTPSTYATVRPIFLIRDPIRVFDSWKKVGWIDEKSLVHCYTNLCRMLHEAPAHAISCLLYEHLVQEPQREIRRICARWGVPFSETMLDFEKPFGSAFIYASDREKSIYLEKKPLGLFTTVEASSSIQPDVPYHGLLSNTEKDHIEEQLGRLYIKRWGSDVLRLGTILAEKTWIGFDLDDTLHEFRRSSGTATNKVLEEISNRFGALVPELKDEYSRVLREKTANAFSDGKTSFDYRRERFTSVMAHFSLPQDDQFMDELLELYELTLMASLELKCGAIGLLSTLKDMGKKIVIMTEGPQDAQERTVQGLGISDYIDFLATTNYFGVTKTNGLFPKVLEHLEISSGDIAYIGDNEQRDMEPAMAEGIFSIHLAETKHVSLNTFPPQVNTLNKLQYIVSDTDP